MRPEDDGDAAYDRAKDDGRILPCLHFPNEKTFHVKVKYHAGEDEIPQWEVHHVLRQHFGKRTQWDVSPPEQRQLRLIHRHQSSMWRNVMAWFANYPREDALWWWCDADGNPIGKHPAICRENFPNGWNYDEDKPW